MHRRQYLAGVATAATATIAGCGVLSDEGNSNGLVDEAKDKVDPHGMYTDDGHLAVTETAARTINGANYGIEGTLVNLSDVAYAYVELTVSYYAGDGDSREKLAEGYTSTEGLDAGGTWNFETSEPKRTSVNGWEVSEITVEKA